MSQSIYFFCIQFQDSKGVLGNTVYTRETQQLLSALGLMRGFMKPGGVPDETRAARLILKDFVTGKLLLCKAPPDQDQSKSNERNWKFTSPLFPP